VRDTGEVFELIENIQRISKNVNSYTSIYPDTDTGTGDNKVSEKYKISAARADREIITGTKNSGRPYLFNKSRKLIRS
jgi:hypothetical protein